MQLAGCTQTVSVAEHTRIRQPAHKREVYMPVGEREGNGVGLLNANVGWRLGDVDGTEEGATVGSGVGLEITNEGVDVGAAVGDAVVAIGSWKRSVHPNKDTNNK